MSVESTFFDSFNGRSGLSAFLDVLKWDEHGRVTMVSQDYQTLEVLGVAFADRNALQKTLETGLMHYYSRSRRKLWMKGEKSGHYQYLVELRVDCDGDALVARVRQVAGNCHLGYKSCFTNIIVKDAANEWTLRVVGEKVFDPERVYG